MPTADGAATLVEKVPRPRGKLNRMTAGDYVIIAVLAVWGLIILYPFYNAILISIVPQVDYVRTPLMLFPTSFTNDSYEFVFRSELLITSLFNSLGLTVFGTLYNIVLTVLMAYTLTKPVPGRTLIRFLLVFTMYFSGGLIPTYLLIKDIGLLDTYACMVLPTVITISYTMLVSNYFTSIPGELLDAASIDGANELRIMFSVILPLSMPIIATFTVYYAVERWNEWYNGMLYLKAVDKWPLQLSLRKLISDATMINQANLPGDVMPVAYAEGVKMAAIVVTMTPIMAVYPFFQRFFLSGLTVGAVKG